MAAKKFVLLCIAVFSLLSCFGQDLRFYDPNLSSYTSHREYINSLSNRTLLITMTCKVKKPVISFVDGKLTFSIEERVVQGHGSGVILKSYSSGVSYALTAKHVAKPGENCYDYKAYLSSDIDKKSPVSVSTVLVHKTDDVALIKLDRDMGISTSLSRSPFVGQHVTLTGFPALDALKEATYSMSVTSGELATKVFKKGSLRLIRITSPAYFGNSGGAVFDDSSRVVGILVFFIGGGGMPIDGHYYAVSYNVINEMLLTSKYKDILL